MCYSLSSDELLGLEDLEVAAAAAKLGVGQTLPGGHKLGPTFVFINDSCGASDILNVTYWILSLLASASLTPGRFGASSAGTDPDPPKP